jgi:hypothetical protein
MTMATMRRVVIYYLLLELNHEDVLNQEKHSCPTTIIEMILLLTML